MAKMQARAKFDLQRLDGTELRLGEVAHILDGKFRIGESLRVEFGKRCLTLFGRHLEMLQRRLVELFRIVAHRCIATLDARLR